MQAGPFHHREGLARVRKNNGFVPEYKSRLDPTHLSDLL